MNRNIVTKTLAGLMILSTAAMTTAAFAQDGAGIMVMRDDAGGTRVRHMSMPNLEALRTPDFTRKDLPIFTDKLALSDPQSEAIARRIDGYIAAFIELSRDLAKVAGPRAEYTMGPEGNADPSPTSPGAPPLGGPMGGPGVAFDDLEKELPPGSSVNVGISVGINDSGEEGAAPQPSADVQVGIETPDGDDISPELMEKFQERANELAQKMTEQVMAQQEARARGEPPAVGVPQGAGAIVMTPEDMEARQAELQAKIDEFLKAKAKLRATFVTEAQGDLAPPQVERWPSLERALTRERALPRGRISGESSDLVKLLAAQKLSESHLVPLTESMEAYEVDLDGALKRRDAFLADANQGIDQSMSDGDPDKAISIAQKAADLRVAVRKTNVQHAERLAAELGGAEGEAFRAAALRSFYPRLYTVTRGQKLFAACDQLKDVPSDAAAAVAELRRTYEQELATMNEQIRAIMDREEPRERLRGLEELKRTMQGQEADPHAQPTMVRPDDPIRDAFEKRAEMDDRYCKSVASLLPAELAAGLPKPRTHKGPIVIRGGGIR